MVVTMSAAETPIREVHTNYKRGTERTPKPKARVVNRSDATLMLTDLHWEALDGCFGACGSFSLASICLHQPKSPEGGQCK
jgi:hypothetical protein